MVGTRAVNKNFGGKANLGGLGCQPVKYMFYCPVMSLFKGKLPPIKLFVVFLTMLKIIPIKLLISSVYSFSSFLSTNG